MSLIIEVIVVGPFMTNCMVLSSSETKEGIIIDPGDEPERIIEVVRKKEINIKDIVLTHGHIDHIGGVKKVKEEIPATIHMARDDSYLYDNAKKQATSFGLEITCLPKVDNYISDSDIIKFGGYQLTVISTPGHTPGSICLKISYDDKSIVFSGDTIFAGGIGRTDLWGGSYEKLIVSINTKLLVMRDDTVIYPGHGPKTTIGKERLKNPCLLP